MASSWLASMDVLSPFPKLYINGKARFSSAIGGTLAIILAILAIMGFGCFFGQILERKEPSVAMSTNTADEMEYLFNTSETVFIARLADKYGITFEDKIYSMYAEHWEYFKVLKNNVYVDAYNITSLNISRCDKYHKLNSSEFNSLYSSFDTNNSYCLDPGQIIKIKGSFGNSEGRFSYFNVYFTTCTNSPDCENNSTLFTSYYVKCYFTNYYINSVNYSTPLHPYIYQFYDMSSNAFFKRSYAFFKNMMYASDDGLILEDTKTFSKTIFSHTTNILDFRNATKQGEKVLYQLTYAFNSGGIEEHYLRSYKKIQNVIAEMGGFLSSLKIICTLLLHMYHEVTSANFIYKDFILNLTSKGIQENKIEPFTRVKINKCSKRDHTIVQKNQMISCLGPGQCQTSDIICSINPSESANLKKFTQIEFDFKRFLLWRGQRTEYSLAIEKLKKYYLNISNLVKMQNEIDVLSAILLKDNPLCTLFSHLTRMISLKPIPKFNSTECVKCLQSIYTENPAERFHIDSEIDPTILVQNLF